MKHLKLFFALFAMLALGVGNAWGANCDYSDDFSTVNVNTSYSTRTTTEGWNATYTAVEDYTYNSKSYRAFKMNGKKGGLGKITSPLFSDGCSAISFVYGQAHKDAIKFDVKIYDKNNVELFSKSYNASKPTAAPTAGVLVEETITGVEGDFYVVFANTSTSTSTSNGYRVSIMNVCITSAGSGSEETVVSVPTFSVPEGTFYSPINVELSCATADAEIHYTLDGNTPTSTSEKYTTAIAISETTIVKAIAVKDGLTNSEVATATYTKGETVTSYDIDFEKNALEAYVNWDFSNITITTTTIKAKAGTYYANTSGKASASIKTKEKIQYPGILTFSVSKETNNETASSWKVQVSENGSTWTDVTSLSAADMSKGAWNDYSVDLSDYENVYVQISYGGSTAVRAIDEISLAQGVAPVKYTLTIEGPKNGTLSVTKGGVSVASGDQFKAGTSLVVTPAPASGYVFESLTVDGSAVELTDGKYSFTMPENDVTISATFKENEKPAATLTLSKNGETEDITGNKQDDVVTLPTTVDTDCVKKFVGWSTEAIEEPLQEKPTSSFYEPGASYTLASTSQTLYAVYATVEGGEVSTSEDLFESTGTYNATAGTITWELVNIVSILQEKSNASSAVSNSYVNDPRWYKDHLITITPSANIKEIIVKAQSNDYATALAGSTYTNATATANGDVVTITPIDGNEKITIKMGAQARLSTLTVTYASAATYSDYSTTCSAALANPTFDLAEGKYTEAKSVTISATEGTVYYTLDGNEPTASSTQYTGAIALNDCGEHTIKAIAISADSQSDVVSATYTIKLPLTNSQAAPYTEAEAIAVYDGGCYDNQDVYVKGTVKTATFNSTYGNYTITLTNGFQFYRFLQAAETEFTEDIIVPGDVLVACGKLSKHNTTYQLAAGCYLVERIPYEGEKTDISNTEATAYTVDQAFALIADVSSDLTKEVYVKGLVAVAPASAPNADGQMTYKISDNGENTGNVLTVYLGLNLNGEKFTSKNDVQQGDYVVVKGKLLDYNSTYELNKGNQLVQHVKAATITIADITMEVGDTKTIAVTITPAAAESAISYSIKENTANAIALSGSTITANAVGTATITATIATAAEYMGKTVDFTVTVNAKSTKEKVVILAKYGDQWYAMMAQYVSGKTSHLAALPVTYVGGKLYNVADADKTLIEWERTVVDGTATFSNNSKYLTGKSDKTDLTLAATSCNWTISGDSYLIGARTFLYNAENNWFRNFGTSNAGNKNYSGMPTVTAPVYATGQAYGRSVNLGTDGYRYGTICLPFGSTNFTGAEFFECVGKEESKVYIGSVTTLVAGTPYIFLANATEVAVYGDGTTAATAGNSKGLYGTFENETVVAANDDNHILLNNELRKVAEACWVNANRAYLVMSEVPTEFTKMPGRRYIGMDVEGENEATGFENITAPADKAVKAIINGQLIIIRDGEMYNAMGVKL